MRAPGLLPLLPLLLLGVSSQDPSPAGAGGDGMTSTDTKNQQTTTATSTGKTPQLSPSISGQTTITATNPGGITGKSLTTAPTTTTNSLGTTPSTTTVSHNTGKGTTTPANQGNPPPATTTPSHLPQQVSPSGTSGAPITSPTTTQSAGQQQAVPSSRSLRVTTPENTVSTRVSSPAGGLEAAKTSSPSTQPQGSQSLDQLTKATQSTGMPRISTTPGPNSQNVPSSTSDTKQPHSSSSPDKASTSAAKPGSIITPAGTLSGSLSPTTTSTAPLTSPPDSTRKILEAATLTPGTGAPDQRSHSVGTMSSKAISASRSTASALPSTPALGDQTVPSSPGLQHPNTSFQNEVICKDLVQNNESTMYLKEAKTCDEWKMVSNDISFFESFCSTGQHTFNPSRERCTVTLMSPEPRSHQWAVSAVLHLPLDADKVLKQLKDKDKLEELGIANITDKAEREMIINDEFSTPLIITIVTLAGSLLLIAAIYGCCHQRFSQKKDQHIHPDLPGFDDGHVALIFNRLTEELQTMENGYHDNPTLEVMETSSEMQEKKVNLNGELGDSWIVPLDTLMKDDLEEEEDTHL